MAEYLPTIGIETHVQLSSKTKLFAAVGNDAREAEPNTLISHICVGMPGALPVLNEGALKLAARAAYALGSEPQKFSHFDRKHYFYPDLPKGYQITQYKNPIILGGRVEIEVDGQKKTINITRAHLEEDAGKTTHPEGADYSLVDLNRAGTPLLEIVSEPEIHSAAEAKAYTRELYLLMKYAQVSNVDLYHGNMRFDVNISLSDKEGELGKRAEVKNLNSFRSVETAIEYEIKRQTELLSKGEEVIQETRGWDEAKQKTTAQRGKEEAHDYRYFPDPDLPPIELSDEFVNVIKTDLPKLPEHWRTMMRELGLDGATVETLLDIEVEDDSINYLGVIDSVREDADRAKMYANWAVNIEAPARRKNSGIDSHNKAEIYRGVYDLFSEGKIHSNAAKDLLLEGLSSGRIPTEELAKEKGYLQVSDESELEEIVKKVIAENGQAADDVRAGEMKAIGFLVGQVMKASAGKANPGIVQKIIKQQLGV